MAYIYMQKPKPTNAIGVQVHLTAIDSNGNLQEIGTATSDTNGNYGIMWTPPIEGQYKVIATFDGTKSYGGSDATTYFGISPAPSAVVTTTSPTQTTIPNPTTTTPAQTISPSPSSVVDPTNKRNANNNLHRNRSSSHNYCSGSSGADLTKTQISNKNHSSFFIFF